MFGLTERFSTATPVGLSGRVTRLTGLTIEAADFAAPVGAQCRLMRGSDSLADAEVIGFRDRGTLLLPLGQVTGLRPGDRVTLRVTVPQCSVGTALLGRVLDARGRPLDGKPAPFLPDRRLLQAEPPSPLTRRRLSTPLATGIRAIDGLLTCGKGQRLGLFAGSGVGKSTLLGEIAQRSEADINVIILVGERGREVRDFVEKHLGQGLQRSIVIVATSDEAPTLRLRAAQFGTAIAEYFRDQHKDVLLLCDSLTRFAHAQREVGLAAGEPAVARGFPPSVLSSLAKLVERTGTSECGSITGLYSVLVDGDDLQEPVADAIRGLLDGHWVLSRRMAEQAHWPAIDVLASVSRTMPDVVTQQHQLAANSIKRLLATYRHHEDLISLGAYQAGSNPLVDQAIREQPLIRQFLQQAPGETTDFTSIQADLRRLHDRITSTPRRTTP